MITVLLQNGEGIEIADCLVGSISERENKKDRGSQFAHGFSRDQTAFANRAGVAEVTRRCCKGVKRYNSSISQFYIKNKKVPRTRRHYLASLEARAA